MNPTDFQHEYDLAALQLIRPRGHHFEMEVTPRYLHHYVHNSYEAFTADLLANLLSSQRLFIDVGAHYGFYTLLAASRHSHLEVLALEPVRESHAVLTRNIERNGVREVRALQRAASDCDGRALFNISLSSDNCSFYPHPVAPPLYQIEVDTITIDTLLRDRAPCPTVIKMDTDGHELKVLKGMEDTLARFRDLSLVVEFNPKMLKRAGHAPEELLEKLERLGFDVFFIDDRQRRASKLPHSQSWKTLVDPAGYINLYCPRRDRALGLCIFAHSSGLSGAERSLLELTKELVQDHGTICTVVLPSAGPLEEELKRVGASCIIVPYTWWCTATPISPEESTRRLGRSAAAVVGKALTAIQGINPDVLMTNTMVVPWGAAIASLLEKPHVWHVCEFGKLDHGLHFVIPFEEVLEIIRSSSTFVFTTTEYHRRVLFPTLGDRECLPLYRHIEIPPEAPQEHPRDYFTRDGAIRLGIFATISEGKGQEDALRATAELVRRGHNVELLVAGHNADPGYYGRIAQFIEEQKLRPYVRLTGFISSVYAAMRQTDIVLVCSRHEAFGRVAVEAMLLGKAVVYSASGSLPDYMQDGKTGLAYSPGDIPQLVNRIETLLAHPEKARGLGDNGRFYARERFTREHFDGRAYQVLLRIRDTQPTANSSRGRLLMLLLNMLQAHIGTLQAHTEQLQARIDHHEREWESIRATLGWQVLNGYWRCVEVLLPPRTRRRRLYDKMFSALRSLRGPLPRSERSP